MITFPRQTVRVGSCLAYRLRSGKINKKRPYIAGGWICSRLAYSLNVATIPKNPPNRKEGNVLHTCDHIWCIDPNHLYLGTVKQNRKDALERTPNIRKHMSEAQTGRRATLSTRKKLSVGKIGNLNRLGYKEKRPEVLEKIANRTRCGFMQDAKSKKKRKRSIKSLWDGIKASGFTGNLKAWKESQL